MNSKKRKDKGFWGVQILWVLFRKQSVVVYKVFLPSFVKPFFEEVCEFRTGLMNTIEQNFFKLISRYENHRKIGRATSSWELQEHDRSINKPWMYSETGETKTNIVWRSWCGAVERWRELKCVSESGILESWKTRATIGRESCKDCGETKMTCGEHKEML